MWETWVQKSLGWEDPPEGGDGNPLQLDTTEQLSTAQQFIDSSPEILMNVMYVFQAWKTLMMKEWG